MATGDASTFVLRRDGAQHTKRRDDRRIWKDKWHILNQLGVPVMQELLGEVHKSLSPKETKSLKDRFRRRFKPTDAAVLEKITGSSDIYCLATETTQLIGSSQSSEKPRRNGNSTVDAGHETQRPNWKNNTPLWKDKSLILSQLGIPVMQELLNEEPRELSRKETYLLKKRFRFRFKPTDDVITTKLQSTTHAHLPQSRTLRRPKQCTTLACETVTVDQRSSVGNADDVRYKNRANKRRRLNDKTNEAPAKHSDADALPDIIHQERSPRLLNIHIATVYQPTSDTPCRDNIHDQPVLVDPKPISHLQKTPLTNDITGEPHQVMQPRTQAQPTRTSVGPTYLATGHETPCATAHRNRRLCSDILCSVEVPDNAATQAISREEHQRLAAEEIDFCERQRKTLTPKEIRLLKNRFRYHFNSNIKTEIRHLYKRGNEELQKEIQHLIDCVKEEIKNNYRHLVNELKELRAMIQGNVGGALRSTPEHATPEKTAAASMLALLAKER
mmetsp:Transcript_24387/g.69561  ORF Transcript_24387/g.69561 Transcript_24387/m.69561 type:complete len:501 (-) Transcript_24387:217-1719(-)